MIAQFVRPLLALTLQNNTMSGAKDYSMYQHVSAATIIWTCDALLPLTKLQAPDILRHWLLGQPWRCFANGMDCQELPCWSTHTSLHHSIVPSQLAPKLAQQHASPTFSTTAWLP